MPALWQRLRQPHPWLGLWVFAVVVTLADTYRQPANQVTGRAYVGVVGLYQTWGRPLLAGRIRCRYRPTCSDYSIGAVQRHGLLAGLVLTWRRVRSCTPAVPAGTADPVP